MVGASVTQDPVVLHHEVTELIWSGELGVLAFEGLFADRTGQAARPSDEYGYAVVDGFIPQFP